MDVEYLIVGKRVTKTVVERTESVHGSSIELAECLSISNESCLVARIRQLIKFDVGGRRFPPIVVSVVGLHFAMHPELL